MDIMQEILLEAAKPSFSKTKRKKMEETIYEAFSIIDPSGTNTDYYKEFFQKMSDKEFQKFFETLFANEDMYIILHTCDYEYDITLPNINKGLKYLGIPFLEYVIKPFDTMDKEHPVVTPSPIPVGYVHIKPMQQLLAKKNKGSTGISERSALTNQVVGKDKNGRMTDMENYNFVVNGGREIAKEFMSLRGDDVVMQTEALASIAEKGYLDMNELTDLPKNKTVLNVVDTYLIGMGIKSDLVTKDLALLMTIED